MKLLWPKKRLTILKISKDRYITNIDIPLDEAVKVRLVHGKKKTVPEWQRELGADIVVNGALYNTNGIPIEQYKTDGRVLSTSTWCTNGFGIGTDQKTVIFGNFNDYY